MFAHTVSHTVLLYVPLLTTHNLASRTIFKIP